MSRRHPWVVEEWSAFEGEWMPVFVWVYATRDEARDRCRTETRWMREMEIPLNRYRPRQYVPKEQ